MKKARPIKAIGRKRRTLGWTLLTLGLLVAGVWVASGLGWASATSGTYSLQVSQGGISLTKFIESEAPASGWEHDKFHDYALMWVIEPGRPHLSSKEWYCFGVAAFREWPDDAYWNAGAVLWPIPLLLWTPAALLLRSGYLARRRVNTGQCGKCGYSLAGLAPDAPCPECGKGAGIT